MRVNLLRSFFILSILTLSLVASGAASYLLPSGAGVDTAVTTTFQVNMSIKMREGTFLPGSNDSVWVRGNFNNWGTTLLTDGNGDSIYTATVIVDSLYNSPTRAINIGDTIQYKYFKTSRGGIDWEGGNNRELVATGSSVSTPVDFFDHDTVYN